MKENGVNLLKNCTMNIQCSIKVNSEGFTLRNYELL